MNSAIKINVFVDFGDGTIKTFNLDVSNQIISYQYVTLGNFTLMVYNEDKIILFSNLVIGKKYFYTKTV